LVLDRKRTLALLKEKDVVYMRADITEEQPVPQAVLEALENRAHAIPYLVIFPGDKQAEPRVLSDFNVFNPWGYRSRLFRVLAECPDPTVRQTADARN
jgi:hypothetical protein